MNFVSEFLWEVSLSRIEMVHLREEVQKVDFDFVISYKNSEFNQRGHFMGEVRLVN
jgi:hypothetical protein